MNVIYFYKNTAFKICSWNVAGLRALMRNHPNALGDLAKKYDLDVIWYVLVMIKKASFYIIKNEYNQNIISYIYIVFHIL